MNIKGFLKKYPEISLLKDYSGLILAIPTVLAGIHQSGILISINSNLLSFFSVSSLAKDGIVLTFQSLLLFLLSYYYRLVVTRFLYKRYKKYLNKLNIITTIIGFTLLFFSKNYALENYAYAVLFLAMFFYINNAIFLKKDIFSVSGIYIGQLLIVIMINSLFAAFPNYQIRNIDNINNQVSKVHPKAKLLYFNDQFLFYSLKSFSPKDPKKDILVVKIDEMFETYGETTSK